MRWTFEISESAKIAWSAIRANRLRSILTTLGIVVGIVTVTLMGMAIEGLSNAFKQSIATLGADTLYVQRIPWMRITYLDWMRLQKRRPIDLAQSRELERRMTNALALAAMTETRLTVQYKGGEKKILVPETAAIVSFTPAERSELKAGASIFVTAQRQPDGSLTAGRVNVGVNGQIPPM